MAATAWSFYNSFKDKLGNALFDLNATTYDYSMALFTNSASTNANNVVLSTYASIGNEVAGSYGYATGGVSVSGRTWTSVATNKFRWDATAVVWTATGGDIADIKYAIIYKSGGALVCFSKLSTSHFTLTQDNTLTITPNANGIFELS